MTALKVPGAVSSVFVCVVTSLTLLFAAYCPAHAEVQISSYYGDYDVSQKKSGQQALSLRGPKEDVWKTPAKPAKSYRIGVCFPHLKDSYWLGVNYGMVDEAKKLGVSIVLKEAGGYANLSTQQEQIEALVADGVDGIILGSISYTGNNALVGKLAEAGVPVVEVVNDIEAPAIAAKALVSFYEMGYYAGEHAASQSESNGQKKVNVVFLPGPKGSGWADDTLEGFKSATEFFDGEMKILDVKWGNPDASTQGQLIKDVMAAHPNADFIVGNAVAATEAMKILPGLGSKAKIISTYITPSVFQGIEQGKINASPSDRAADQARIAVGMLVRLLNGEKPGKDFPFRAGPMIPVITPENIADYKYETLFGPRDFKPVFNYQP